jgi:chaperone modulatory protein CbpM
MAGAGQRQRDVSILGCRSGKGALIRDLKADFGVNDEGIGIILHLLDQLYGLRYLVRDIHAMGAVDRTKDVG